MKPIQLIEKNNNPKKEQLTKEKNENQKLIKQLLYQYMNELKNQ